MTARPRREASSRWDIMVGLYVRSMLSCCAPARCYLVLKYCTCTELREGPSQEKKELETRKPALNSMLRDSSFPTMRSRFRLTSCQCDRGIFTAVPPSKSILASEPWVSQTALRSISSAMSRAFLSPNLHQSYTVAVSAPGIRCGFAVTARTIGSYPGLSGSLYMRT